MTTHAQPQHFRVSPGGHLQGHFRVPGDKSISHRAVMFSMVAAGTSKVSGLLHSEDVKATLACCETLGATVVADGDSLQITGLNNHISKSVATTCDMGNSGTAMRLLTGLLCGHDVDIELIGDESLSSRPMRRIADPLVEMGARIQVTEAGTPPVIISRGASLQGIDYTMTVASAQVKSAVLLAGLRANGETRVHEPRVSRDHTERMLRSFGVNITSLPDEAGGTVSLQGGQPLRAADVTVPGDLSSAAFFIVGALIAPQSEITLAGVGINPTRKGLLAILERMGAQISITPQDDTGDEPIAQITVKTSQLSGVEIGADLVALAIDEIPAVAIAAACAQGTTRITGAAELRVKESDRIAGVVSGLRALGINAQELPDGMIIEGGAFHAGEVESLGDHRLAMAFSMAALRSDGDVIIKDINNIATSFPQYYELASKLGLRLERLT